ncbi:MAG: hypothetical protein PVS2B2_27380 [Candidatus Acidiferrum sp.]
MSIKELLLVIGILLTVAAVVLGHHCLVFAVQGWLGFVAIVLLSAVGT